MPSAPVLTPQAEDFPRWYQDVIAKAELADNGPVRGTMVIRPYGYAHLGADAGRDGRPDQGGGRGERLLPAVHPGELPAARGRARRGLLPGAGGRHPRRRQGARRAARRAADQRDGHRRVHGASGSRATATCRCCSTSGRTWSAGSCARGSSCARASSSGRRATPRTPRRPRPRGYARRIQHEVYQDFMVDGAGDPGPRSACKTDARALRRRDQHVHLRGHDARRQGAADGHQPRAGPELRPAPSTSATPTRTGRASTAGPPPGASSTRMVGGLIMCHGDDNGLRLPPRLAPIQVVVIVGQGRRRGRSRRPRAGRRAARRRRAGRARRPDRRRPSAAGVDDWELKGVPLRVEVGPRDLAAGNATVTRRDTGERSTVPSGGLAEVRPGPAARDPAWPGRRGGRALRARAAGRRDDRRGAGGRRDGLRPHPVARARARGRAPPGCRRDLGALPSIARRRRPRRPRRRRSRGDRRAQLLTGDLEQVGDHHVAVAELRWYASDSSSTRPICSLVSSKSSWNWKKA